MTYDLVVLGGGTAGLVAALGAAGLGARVALVERARPGGDCLWTGCVPSKSLIAAADAAHRVRSAGRLGIVTAPPRVDFAAVMAHVHGAIAAIEPHDSAERLTREGVDVITGDGRFTGRGSIRVTGARGRFTGHGRPELDERELRFRRAVIATGSAPALPPIPGLADADALTSDDIWELGALPGRLIVVGGGPIGCELGQAFARLGSRVTLLEVAPQLLARDHPDAGAIVHARLVDEGLDVRTGVTISAVARRDGEVEVLLGDGAAIAADQILVAAGRAPRTADLGLDAVGVARGERGHIVVDARLRTTARGIYAAGDVTGAPAFTHVAGYHGGLVVQNALLGLRRRVAYGAVPAVTYTDPEVAGVGRAASTVDRARVARFDHATSDRAITEDDTDGFTELVGDRRGRLVGATVVGPTAGETIAALAAHVTAGTRLGTIAGTVHAYPTRSDAIQRAALDDLRRSLVRYRRPLAVWLGVRRRLVR